MSVPARALAVVLLALTLAGAADARAWSWLGVRIRDLSEQEMDELSSRHGLAEGFGVVIVEVMEGTPAERAGMRAGDIVVAFEGRPVTETRLLQRLIAQAPIDRDIRLTVLRTAGRKALPVRLVNMPRLLVGEQIASRFGFVLRDTETTTTPSANVPAVTFVAKGSPAERGGLEAGDVILQVEDQAVLTRDAAREALSDVPTERPLRLTVRRRGEHVGLTLAAPDSKPQP
ncbi:MAG TPA: PDZ domain-containing protein [Candidatus Binatia bacterium]|nr:PDZ domain-containing protein [Candidatus Binatia bacterium]